MQKVLIKAEKEVLVPRTDEMNEEEIKEVGKELGTFDVTDIRAGEGPLRRIDEVHVTEVELVEDDDE